MVPLFANVLGELWGWVTGVFGRVGDVSIYWLLLALALKTAESALIALGWRLLGGLGGGGFEEGGGAWEGGATNAVTPARGTGAMIGFGRASVVRPLRE